MPLNWTAAGEPHDIARALEQSFLERHGHPPHGVHFAPGRVNLIGEHLDYNGGTCLPMALEHGTYAALAARDDNVVTIASLQQADPWLGTTGGVGPGDVTGWAAYVAGVLWALQQDGLELPGMDIIVDSRVPVGAGLSSSAALECSVAVAVCDLLGLELDHTLRRRLVAACMRAEGEVAGAPTGGMDQTISLLAQVGHALWIDCRDLSGTQVPWAPAQAGLTLLVVDTRASHTLNDGGYASRRQDCEDAAAQLGVPLLADVTDPEAALARLDDDRLRRRVRHVLSEIDRVSESIRRLDAGDVAGLGPLMIASHASLRDDFEVSCLELDLVVETALAQGAVGARMTGGGFGGSAIALVPDDRVAAVAEALESAFADAGLTPPSLLTSTAGPGAGPLTR